MDTKFGYNLDRYELWGYLIPGLLILLLVWYFGDQKLVDFSVSSWENILWFLIIFCIAYVIGMILHWMAQKIFHIFDDVIYPIHQGKCDEKYGIYFANKLIEEIHDRYTLGENEFLDKCGRIHRNVYDLCYNSKPVLDNPLISIYLARAIMLRNLFLVSIFAFLLGLFYNQLLFAILSVLSIFVFWDEANRVGKILYKTVFITWWENYHRE